MIPSLRNKELSSFGATQETVTVFSSSPLELAKTVRIICSFNLGSVKTFWKTHTGIVFTGTSSVIPIQTLTAGVTHSLAFLLLIAKNQFTLSYKANWYIWYTCEHKFHNIFKDFKGNIFQAIYIKGAYSVRQYLQYVWIYHQWLKMNKMHSLLYIQFFK